MGYTPSSWAGRALPGFPSELPLCPSWLLTLSTTLGLSQCLVGVPGSLSSFISRTQAQGTQGYSLFPERPASPWHTVGPWSRLESELKCNSVCDITLQDARSRWLGYLTEGQPASPGEPSLASGIPGKLIAGRRHFCLT